MTITYRNAGLADAATLDRIFDTVFSGTFGHLYRAEDLDAFLSSFGVADWEAQLTDPAFAFRIAEADGEPVGYVKLGPLHKLPVETESSRNAARPILCAEGTSRRRDCACADGLGVRRSGRRGAEELYLTVYVDNHRARRFYDRYGFEVVGRYDFMVGSHADEDVIMRKSL